MWELFGENNVSRNSQKWSQFFLWPLTKKMWSLFDHKIILWSSQKKMWSSQENLWSSQKVSYRPQRRCATKTSNLPQPPHHSTWRLRQHRSSSSSSSNRNSDNRNSNGNSNSITATARRQPTASQLTNRLTPTNQHPATSNNLHRSLSLQQSHMNMESAQWVWERVIFLSLPTHTAFFRSNASHHCWWIFTLNCFDLYLHSSNTTRFCLFSIHDSTTTRE